MLLDARPLFPQTAVPALIPSGYATELQPLGASWEATAFLADLPEWAKWRQEGSTPSSHHRLSLRRLRPLPQDWWFSKERDTDGARSGLADQENTWHLYLYFTDQN